MWVAMVIRDLYPKLQQLSCRDCRTPVCYGEPMSSGLSLPEPVCSTRVPEARSSSGCLRITECPVFRALGYGLADVLALPDLSKLRELVTTEPVVSNERL